MVEICQNVQLLEEQCNKSLEEAAAKGRIYSQLFQEVEDESRRLKAYMKEVLEWKVAKDHLEAEKFGCMTM